MKETVWEQQHAFDLHRYRLLSAVPPIWTLVWFVCRTCPL